MSRVVDRCPACKSDAVRWLELHVGADGDETGTWPTVLFECARCGATVAAENNAGEWVPVGDEDCG